MKLNLKLMLLTCVAPSAGAILSIMAYRYIDDPRMAIIVAVAALAISLATIAILTATLKEVIDDQKFLYVPRLARRVNGAPSTVGIDQPPDAPMGSEMEARAAAMKFMKVHYPGRKDLLPAHMKCSLDEFILKPIA